MHRLGEGHPASPEFVPQATCRDFAFRELLVAVRVVAAEQSVDDVEVIRLCCFVGVVDEHVEVQSLFRGGGLYGEFGAVDFAHEVGVEEVSKITHAHIIEHADGCSTRKKRVELAQPNWVTPHPTNNARKTRRWCHLRGWNGTPNHCPPAQMPPSQTPQA